MQCVQLKIKTKTNRGERVGVPPKISVTPVLVSMVRLSMSNSPAIQKHQSIFWIRMWYHLWHCFSILTVKVSNSKKRCTISKILSRLTEAQKRITIFISVTWQKLYTIGVGIEHYLPQWFSYYTLWTLLATNLHI